MRSSGDSGRPATYELVISAVITRHRVGAKRRPMTGSGG
jgi:hypothetical protein